MSSTLPQAPQQWKMRASCNACGNVKLKCDRQHPQCGRCAAQGITCTYSISRKLGKPPRERTINVRESVKAASSNTATSAINGLSGGTVICPTTNSRHASLSSLQSYTSDAFDINDDGNSKHRHDIQGDHDIGMWNLDCLEDGSWMDTMSTNFPINFGDPLDKNDLDREASGFALPSASVDPRPDLDIKDSSMSQPSFCQLKSSGSQDGDCYREAYCLLGSLLFREPFHGHLETPPMTEAPSTMYGIENGQTPFDQLLLENHRAIERMKPLVVCPCASSPSLIMLYASAISAILSRYQQAAGNVLAASLTTCDPRVPRNAVVGAHDNGSAMCMTGPAAAPPRILVGIFSVDDARLKYAMNFQLLAFEVTKVADLIAQFTSCHSKSHFPGIRLGESNYGATFQSFTVWLESEYSRVRDAIEEKRRQIAG